MLRRDARYSVCVSSCIASGLSLHVHLTVHFFPPLSQLREDELKTRLRTKSARVRAPAPTFSTEVDEDAAITPVERIQHPLTADPLDPPLFSPIPREEAEGEEHVREAAGDGRECREGADRREEGGEGGENRGEGAERGSEGGEEDEEELTQVEALKKDQLLVALEELENDSSFQRAEDKEEMF